MRLRRRHRADAELSRLLGASARVIERSGQVLAELLVAWPEDRHLAEQLRELEHENDRIAHDIIHRLGSRARGAPFDVGDGHALASALDDVVDFAEETADALVLYAVEAPMEQAVQLGEVLHRSCAELGRAVRALADGTDASEHLVEIHRLENEGDRLERDALASLFAEGIDPMVVIRWKDVFASLEAAVDACETAAHHIEGILLKRAG